VLALCHLLHATNGALLRIGSTSTRGTLRQAGTHRGCRVDLSAAATKAELVSLCQDTADNGVGASQERQEAIETAIEDLESYCMPAPAELPLEGVYDLLYCTAPGGSSGKVGPFVGKVTQTFMNGVEFINAVELFGAAKLSLYAERKVLDDKRIRVTFKQTAVSIFGTEVFRKDIEGSGVWQQRYVDDTLRVMNTPSIFVLQKRK